MKTMERLTIGVVAQDGRVLLTIGAQAIPLSTGTARVLALALRDVAVKVDRATGVYQMSRFCG